MTYAKSEIRHSYTGVNISADVLRFSVISKPGH